MTPERWLRIKEITADAMEQSPAEREPFVERACGADQELHHEVLHILKAAAGMENGFLESRPWNLGRMFPACASSEPTLAAGQVLAGRFEISAFLKRGGMGEVYAAFDRELQEQVALKTILPAIAQSAAVIDRFKQEVRQTRRITHPHVGRVYDLFSHRLDSGETLWFLSMELLHGQTLAERLESGPLSLRLAVPLAADMVAGLSAAHALGIVHRDFKPSNVMLVKDPSGRERAVVMDFGLAAQAVSADGPATAFGGGTPAYMAPEQANGSPPGTSADQFAFGMVLCEMLTGDCPESPMRQSDFGRYLGAWLAARKSLLKPKVRRVASRCLALDPGKRFADIGAAGRILCGNPAAVRVRLLVAAAVLALGAALAALSASQSGYRITGIAQLTAGTDLSGSPSLSADGKWIAYMSDRFEPGNLDIWLQQLPSGAPRRLTTHPAEDGEPSISPDGSLIAFRSERDGGGIYLVNAKGSSEHLLIPGGRRPQFSPDGQFLAYWKGDRDPHTPSGEAYVVPIHGGAPLRLAPDFSDARNPIWNSDGRHILFEGCPANPAPMPGCLEWWVVDARGGSPVNSGGLAQLKGEETEPQGPPEVWSGNQVLVSARHGSLITLWEKQISPEDGKARRRARQVTTSGTQERAATIAAGGHIAFGRVFSALHIWRIDPPSHSGLAPALTKITDDLGSDGCPSISVDGRRLFFSRRIGGDRLIAVRELATGQESVLVRSAEELYWPVADRTGERVAFESRGQNHVSIRLAARAQTPQTLCNNCSSPSGWFQDKAILYATPDNRIGLLDVNTLRSEVVLSAEADVRLADADWNPNSGLSVFTARARGRQNEIYAAQISPGSPTDRRHWIPVVTAPNSADRPRWAGDGRTIFYLSKRDGFYCLWAQDFDRERAALIGKPYPVAHYHSPRITPERTNAGVLGLAVSGRSVLLNIGEVTETIWTGTLNTPGWLSLFP